jgi:hypothetical protein
MIAAAACDGQGPLIRARAHADEAIRAAEYADRRGQGHLTGRGPTRTHAEKAIFRPRTTRTTPSYGPRTTRTDAEKATFRPRTTRRDADNAILRAADTRGPTRRTPLFRPQTTRTDADSAILRAADLRGPTRTHAENTIVQAADDADRCGQRHLRAADRQTPRRPSSRPRTTRTHAEKAIFRPRTHAENGHLRGRRRRGQTRRGVLKGPGSTGTQSVSRDAELADRSTTARCRI